MCVCYVYECMLGWGGAVDISAPAQCSNVQLQSPTFLSRMHRAVLGWVVVVAVCDIQQGGGHCTPPPPLPTLQSPQKGSHSRTLTDTPLNLALLPGTDCRKTGDTGHLNTVNQQ